MSNKIIDSFADSKILVVGDVMLDQFWSGSCQRISPEAPVPVVAVKHNSHRPGGAANVGLNIASLGAKVSIIGAIGNDISGRELTELLQQQQVTTEFITYDHCPTITKLRILAQQQQLLRIDCEQKIVIDDQIQQKFTHVLHNDRPDVIILSDYNKGVLSDPQFFIQHARKYNIPVLIDPKLSDFSYYRGATLLTPNLSEFETAVGASENKNEFIHKAQNALKQYNLNALLVTCGADGMYLFTSNSEYHHITTKAQEVYDVTGAGDTVIAVLSLAYSAKLSLLDSAELANFAAGIVVGKIGTATVSRSELAEFFVGATNEIQQGIITENDLPKLRQFIQKSKEKLVVTNGCFDLLHAGHVLYLQQARKLGSRLLVLVNSDRSIRTIKGKSRPINTASSRMEVLAGLRSVDWVLEFDELTPERLIKIIKPDYLAKGGDYDIASIKNLPEAQFVQKYGGEVRVLGYQDGCSTTKIVEKIHAKELV